MRGAKRLAFWAALAAVVVAGALMASPARAATFVYVGNAESNEIYVLQLDRQSGDLTVVEKVPIPGIEKPGNSTPMSVSPDRRFLYIGTRGEPKVAAGFAIDQASGKLKHVASGPLATRGAKRIMNVGQAAGFAAARALSDALRHALEWSRDVDEGMVAHREGRPPRFTGR